MLKNNHISLIFCSSQVSENTSKDCSQSRVADKSNHVGEEVCLQDI